MPIQPGLPGPATAARACGPAGRGGILPVHEVFTSRPHPVTQSRAMAKIIMNNDDLVVNLQDVHAAWSRESANAKDGEHAERWSLKVH